MNDLRLIVLDNIEELGNNVNEHLKEINNNPEEYIIPIKRDRFSNGEGKISINGMIRDKDIFILSDVGNYDITYNMHGFTHHMAPDEHFQDIKRVISATSGHASRITVVMPLLYQSRQHKRKGRESLDCALGLQEIENLGIKNFVTLDAHDPNVANAVPRMAFENFYPTNMILDRMLQTEDMTNLQVISPDLGAMERARFYAEMVGCDVGCFYNGMNLQLVRRLLYQDNRFSLSDVRFVHDIYE